MAGINEEVEMHDDRGERGEPEQGAEVYDDIAQNAGKEEELEYGETWKFDGETDIKGSDVAYLQESSIGEEDMDNDLSNLQSCDFFSERDTQRHAGYLHGQAGEVTRPFQLYSTASICSRTTPLSVYEDEQPLSLRERNILALPQQSKLASISTREVPFQFSCLELPPNLTKMLGAGGASDSSTNQRKRSGTFEIRKLRSFFEPMNSKKVSTMDFLPRSNFLRALNDCKWQGKFSCALHASQDEGHCSATGDLRGNFHHRVGERPTEFVVKILPSIPRNFSGSNNFLARVPESFDLALAQQKSELEDAKVRRSTQVTPFSICCVGSSQFANLGTEIVRVNEPTLSKGISSHRRSEENDDKSDAAILEKRKQEDFILTLGVEKSEALTLGKSEGICALDLLVSAIQVTSGERFSREDVPGPPEIIKSVIEADNDARCESEEVFFLYGRAPVVRKRVIRRARNAFKRQHGENSLLNAMRFITPEFAPDVTFGRRKRIALSDEKHGVQQEKNEPNLGFPEVANLKDGDPLIRSKRGRYQVLPTKFSDSILQPWKRIPRRQQKAKLKLV